MENVILNNTNKITNYTAVSSASCYCVQCGGCLFCVIFAPAVGAALGLALGLNEYSEMSFKL